MNNVWTSIAFRAPCAIPRHTRSNHFLQLFNGYAKQQCRRRYASQRPSDPVTLTSTDRIPSRVLDRAANLSTKRCFAASGYLQKKQRMNSQKSLLNKPGKAVTSTLKSKLEPAQTVASHTEGLPAEGEEQLTWRDYDPEGGMPLPEGELRQAEINAVFDGEKVDVETGNYILSVMHWRRMSGALIDTGLVFPKNSGVDRVMALRALEYLRRIMPDVDESAAGQIWAAEESHRLQEELQQRAVKLGLYKAQEEEIFEEEQQGTEYGREKSGRSALETIRAENQAKWKRIEAEKKSKAEREANAALYAARGPLELHGGVQPESVSLKAGSGPGGITLTGPQTKAWLQPVERKPWVKYYEEQATIIKDQTIPQLSTVQRLAPSFMVLLIVLAASWYLSENYTPPPKAARIMRDTPPAVATIYALSGILLATFILGRLPPLWRTYSKYLTLVPAYPFAASLLGAAFRHDTLAHLGSNLIPLWLFGLMLHEDVGRGTFLAIFLASGAVGGFSSLMYNVLRQQWGVYIFGSSGCVLGVVGAACALRPNGTIKVAGYEIPIAAWVFLAIFTGAEAFAAVRGVKTVIDHAGHLGGIAAGFTAGMLLRQKAAKEQLGEKVMQARRDAVEKERPR